MGASAVSLDKSMAINTETMVRFPISEGLVPT